MSKLPPRELTPKEKYNNLTIDGMPMREYYAAKAIQGILIRSAADIDSYGMAEKWAGQAFKIADAMLKEGAK